MLSDHRVTRLSRHDWPDDARRIEGSRQPRPLIRSGDAVVLQRGRVWSAFHKGREREFQPVPRSRRWQSRQRLGKIALWQHAVCVLPASTALEKPIPFGRSKQ